MRARRGAGLARSERISDLLLTPGERRRLGECAVQCVQGLLAPRRGERVASLAQLLGQAPERIGGLLAGAARPARIALAGGVGGFLHGVLGATRGGFRRLERYRLTGPFDAVGQRIGGRGKVTLGGDGSRVGARCVFLVPLRLPALQVLGVFRERRQLSLEGRALE